MTVRISKPEFNLREKIKLEIDKPVQKMPVGSVIQTVIQCLKQISSQTNIL